MKNNVIKILRYTLAGILTIPIALLYLTLALPIIGLNMMRLEKVVDYMLLPLFLWMDLFIDEY